MPAEYGHLNEAVSGMLDRITSVGGVIDAALQPIYFIVGVLLLVFACIKFMWQRSLSPFAIFVIRYIQLMVLIFVSGQWMPLTDNYVSQMGDFGANAAGFNILQLAPSAVIIRAMEIANRMYAENVSWMRVIFGSTEDTVAHLLLLVGCIGTILMAVFMAAWIMLFFVVFKLAAVVALVFLAFLMFEGTRFMAAPGLARILAYGVQMLVLGLTTGLFFMTLDALDLSGHLKVDQSLALLVVMFFFGLLFKYTTDIAKEQVTGVPTLSLHDTGQLAGRAAATAASMVGHIGTVGLGTLGALRLTGAATAGRYASIPTSTSGAAASSGMRHAVEGGAAEAPATVARLLNRSPIDATWTEARDLPRTAARLLEARRALPPPPRQLPPPRS
ncbi:type IV secretion system protein (plasmid) [Skermanella sp. TT6]|uniref:Type IV secretion system protein n=1 Tax=Skermanella cutis TaxID=2775420 RepID=A0ABX7BJR2_9PROT|nr:type IV secretion system protein [Skermanella sp. TT6]QQP92717.1 type IV secretion system protein [Skermanella sp. TT6]